MTANFLPGFLMNGWLLLLPILLWNQVFAKKLPAAFSPEIFDRGIPISLTNAENFFRLVVFILPLFMPVSLTTQTQKLGMGLYGAGTVIYFLSWMALMVFPESRWSRSAAGFLAPAYTPLIWLVGIGLVGSSLYFSIPYWPGIYLICAVLFTCVHVSHVSIVYLKSI